MERRRSQEPHLEKVPRDSRYCRNSGRTYLSQELPSHNWGRRANLLTPIVQLEVKSFGGGSDRQNKSTLQSLEPSRRLSDFPGQSECELVCFICPPGDASSST